MHFDKTNYSREPLKVLWLQGYRYRIKYPQVNTFLNLWDTNSLHTWGLAFVPATCNSGLEQCATAKLEVDIQPNVFIKKVD